MSGKKWSQKEIDLLTSSYNEKTNDELLELFPGRTQYQIYKKAYKIGLRRAAVIEFKNRSAAKSGERCNFWSGGTRKTTKGYRQVLCKDHPRADKCGYVMEHIIVWEQFNKMSVPDGYVVHHINEIKTDNRPENLTIMERGKHTTMHHSGKACSEETKMKISKARMRNQC